MPRFLKILLPALFLLFAASSAHAAKIGDITDTNIWDQMLRFFSLRDPSLRAVLLGSVLLGISCGLLGCFIVVRKMSLMGDALSHAVLPGVALGFLWNMTKDPIAIFIGATIAGLLGTLVVYAITHTTRLKEDSALGLVLASFYAVGICLLKRIESLAGGNKSGIDKFLFGQAAALNQDDLILMAVVTCIVVIGVGFFYKELLVCSFDIGFARACGLPTRLLHHGLMLLLAFSVVISLQAVGVVLVSAMLITPAAAAYLLTDRMHRMLLLAAIFGVTSGVLGAFFSFLGNSLPTGPFMVLAASTVFGMAFLFGPRHGTLARWWRQRSRANRVERENTLKAIFHVIEARGFKGEGVSMEELAARRRETLDEARARVYELKRNGLATYDVAGEATYLTPEGWQRARAIVRNHRLWELYLTSEANIAPDHVHEDAEEIEHVLGEAVVLQLEKGLHYATRDPHGKIIPSSAEIYQPEAGNGRDEAVGYGKRS
jgi:ABC-type Mn2+/Zn2+ transport system permease subunit/Mn-dependent DtxR family transcriptional regulator